MQIAVFKPVIFLKKRWLVLFFLIILMTSIFLVDNIFYNRTVLAAENELKISKNSNAVVDYPDFSRYYSSKRMVPIYKVARIDKKISLTIDGAWGITKTEAILDLFSDYDIKISFFFAGRWLKNNQFLAGKILAEGHQIYNHSYNHPHFNSLSKEEIQIELSQTEDLITRLRNKYLNNQENIKDSNDRLKEESDLLKIYRDYIKENIDNDIPIKLNMLILNDELNKLKKLEDVSNLFKISNSSQITNLYKINDLDHYNLKVNLFDYEDQEEIIYEQRKEELNYHEKRSNNNDSLKLFRPPYGEYNDLVVQTAREMGYNVIQWSLDSHDWMDPGKDYVINRIKSNVESGDILLFHNNSPEIIEILRVLIPYLNNNFEIVQIEDLIYQDNYMIRSFDGLQYLVEDDVNEN